MKGTTEVTYQVMVEPTPDRQAALALWLLERDPDIRTASHNSFHVPSGLFTVVPEELLIGARVDGHRYRALGYGLVPDGDGYAAETRVPLTELRIPVNDGARPETLPKAQPRNRRARKAAASNRPKTPDVATDAVVAAAAEAQVSE